MEKEERLEELRILATEKALIVPARKIGKE
jgi:hypothetical protein